MDICKPHNKPYHLCKQCQATDARKTCMKPIYRHDCKECEFVFTVVLLGRLMDVYEGCEGTMAKYLVRFSDKDSDYTTVYPNNAGYAHHKEGSVVSMDHEILELITKAQEE